MLVLEVPEEQVPVTRGINFDVSAFARLESEVAGVGGDLLFMPRERGIHTQHAFLLVVPPAVREGTSQSTEQH